MIYISPLESLPTFSSNSDPSPSIQTAITGWYTDDFRSIWKIELMQFTSAFTELFVSVSHAI